MNGFVKFLTGKYPALHGKKQLVGSASGPWAINNWDLRRLFNRYDYVVLKTVTRQPHVGNTGCTIIRDDDCIVNNIGLKNTGTDQFTFAEVMAEQFRKPVIHSFAPQSADEVAEFCETRDIVELNVSCPNYQINLNMADVLAAIPLDSNKLIGLKLSPVTSYDWAAINRSACGFVTAFNTIPVAIPRHKMIDDVGGVFRGGYSGPINYNRALHFVMQNELTKPIVFCGGIQSVMDVCVALEYCQAVQVGSKCMQLDIRQL